MLETSRFSDCCLYGTVGIVVVDQLGSVLLVRSLARPEGGRHDDVAHAGLQGGVDKTLRLSGLVTRVGGRERVEE